MPIVSKINVSKILKEHLYPGKNGKYLELVNFENKDGPDQYGNHGFITQGLSKEARDRGEKGPIIGNWKDTSKGAPKKEAPPAAPDDDIF